MFSGNSVSAEDLVLPAKLDLRVKDILSVVRKPEA